MPVPTSLPPSHASDASNHEDQDDRLSEATLRALRERDPDAVRRHIYGNRDFLLSVLRRYTDRDQTARDLVSETFLQALRSLPRFRGDSKLTTWLYSIARNVALARYRRNKRRSLVEQETLNSMADSAEDRPAGGSPPTWNPATQTVQGEERTLLHEALTELSTDYREIIRLRDLEEHSTKETAEKLGLTRVNVRVRLHRARKKLAKTLKERVEPDYRIS